MHNKLPEGVSSGIKHNYKNVTQYVESITVRMLHSIYICISQCAPMYGYLHPQILAMLALVFSAKLSLQRNLKTQTRGCAGPRGGCRRDQGPWRASHKLQERLGAMPVTNWGVMRFLHTPVAWAQLQRLGAPLGSPRWMAEGVN